MIDSQINLLDRSSLIADVNLEEWKREWIGVLLFYNCWEAGESDDDWLVEADAIWLAIGSDTKKEW